MEEKRKYERLDIDVKVEIERLDEGDTTTVKYLSVDVTDISRNGIGFASKAALEMDAMLKANITIWTKEVLPAIFKIVRVSKDGGIYHYGAIFVGMREEDALKIQIYQMLKEKEEKEEK